MRAKTTERILSETPQETKDKVRIVTDRHIQLLKFGLWKVEDQQTYYKFKYDQQWYVDFWEVEELDGYEWSVLIDDLNYRLTRAKKQWYDDLREHPAYYFRAKEDKKQILDLLNKYRADLQQVNNFKLDKTVNQEARIRLEVKVEVLKELLKQQKPQE